MAIQAVQQDYKRAFQKHLHAYLNWNKAGSDISRRLVLIYCVECGLKFMLMRKNRIQSEAEAQDDLADDLYSHDFHRLLRRLKSAGPYSFPQIKTAHGDIVAPSTYHQLCRYSIPTVKEHENYVQQYDIQLASIADWLKEKV